MFDAINTFMLCPVIQHRPSYAEMTDGGRWKDLRIIAEAGEEVDGYYVPSERPGHGIILDRDYLATHKI